MFIRNPFATLVLAVMATAAFNVAVMAQSAKRTARTTHDHRVRKVRTTHDHRVPPARRTHDHRIPPKRPTQVPPKRKPHDHRGSASISFEQACQLMAPYRQFMIGANSKGYLYAKDSYNGRAGMSYNIKGLVNRKFLQYEKQGIGRGINIGWTSNASADTATKRAKWFFSKKSGTTNAIRYGEPIAMAWGGNNKNQFVKYSHRTVGINLDWSSKPSYEWVILGGKPGTFVRRGVDRVILFNLKHKQPLVRFDRTVGGDIGWPDSRTWKRQVIDKARDYVNGKRMEIEQILDVMTGLGRDLERVVRRKKL